MPADAIRLEQLPRPAHPVGEVLFITNMWPDDERPYYGSFIHSQAVSLARADVAVDVLYLRGYLGPQVYARAMAVAPRVARRRPYDIVHVHYGHTGAACLGVTRRPLVLSFCGADVIGMQREYGITVKSRVEADVFRWLGLAASATITKSAEMERALPRMLRARNHILSNGVDLEAFAPRPRSAARAALGWEQQGKVMLFLGNPDDPRKNVDLARRAAALVAERVPGARLHEAWAIAPTDVPTYLSAADCLVFPSRGEGSPNAVKEAMACELPIVATPVGDVPERLAGVEHCWVRDPTPEAFADALVLALAADRAPAARRAVESLGLQRVARQLMGIYDQALAARGAATAKFAAA
ncbi:MAG TPA: glycosyltransferase [Baekduia sp.]|nr:glycosyltransferase [Baekduia sp.]